MQRVLETPEHSTSSDTVVSSPKPHPLLVTRNFRNAESPQENGKDKETNTYARKLPD